MLPRNLRPIRLSRRIEPFDSDQFIFELKIDTEFKLKKNGDGNSSKRPAAVSESGNHRGEFGANSPVWQAAREQKVGKFMAGLLHLISNVKSLDFHRGV